MSEKAKQMFDGLKQGIDRFVAEVGAEVSRQTQHGASEVMSGFYTGSGFVQYAPRQDLWSQLSDNGAGHGTEHVWGQGHGQEQQQQQELSRER